MASITKGILGGFSGTVGTVIGGSWKGINYMRSIAASYTNANTQAQQEQRAKFKLGISFATTLTGLFNLSFRNYAVKMSGYNNALSYLLKNAIVGNFPDYSIDYSQVLVSRGDLPNGMNPTAVSQPGSNTKFSWTNNSGVGRAKAGDKTILVLYCKNLKMAVYTTDTATRSEGEAVLNASILKGEVVQSFIGFISEDGKDIASSIYTGELTVTA